MPDISDRVSSTTLARRGCFVTNPNLAPAAPAMATDYDVETL